MRIHPLAPVIALDVDGTIADYYNHFRAFAETYLQRRLPLVWPNDAIDPEFSDALSLKKDVYRDIKLAYRQGGMKRSIPVLDKDENLRTIVQGLRTRGIQVWIATTRPWQRLDNIDPDTRFWLDLNVGRVDGLIYGEDKYLDLVDIVGRKRILGVIDDLPENVVAARGLDLKAAIHKGPHNRVWRDRIMAQGIEQIDSLGSLNQTVIGWHEEYLSNQEETNE